MSQMEKVRDHRGPMLPKVLVFLLLVFGTGATVYLIGNNEVHTPTYTNAFSMFFTILCHVGIVVSSDPLFLAYFTLLIDIYVFIFQIGPAAMFGLRAVNFRLYPSKFTYLFAERSSTKMSRMFGANMLNCFIVPTLCYITLQAVEDLHSYMVVPGCLWFALAASSVFTNQYLLLAPLWLTKHFIKFTAFAFLMTLNYSYRAFVNSAEYD